MKFTLRCANRSMFGVTACGWPPRNPVQSFMSSMAMNSTFGRLARQLERQPRLTNNHVAKMRINKIVSLSLNQGHDTPSTLNFQRCGRCFVCCLQSLLGICCRTDDLLFFVKCPARTYLQSGYCIPLVVRTPNFSIAARLFDRVPKVWKAVWPNDHFGFVLPKRVLLRVDQYVHAHTILNRLVVSLCKTCG